MRVTGLILVILGGVLAAQAPRPDAQTKRVNDRIQALESEARQLAAQSKTLLGELRQLEIERDLRTEDARQAETAATEAQRSLDTTSARVAELEQQRQAQLPDLRAQLVDIYKRGASGYAQMLFGATDVREFGRATRAVASLSKINERRLAEHRATLAALRAERAAMEKNAEELRTRQHQAEQARAAAQRAVAARTALIARIDARRDLTAQYVGELQTAYSRLQQQISSSAAGRVEIPLAPFRGALEWPVIGRITSRFGQADRASDTAVKNGIDIAAPDGTVVKAVHGGTVAFAGPFTGFGTLVILDHGASNFTLYGSLSSAAVDRGAVVDAGTEIGRTGSGAGATPGLYFEVRIDGRSVDPLQWLKPR